MEAQGIYTIGYGGRLINDFIGLLKEYKIEYLIDVRSKPYSKFKPEYSKDPLNAVLKNNGIRYVFMGDLLGGQPQDPTCYTEGNADYDKIAGKDFFQNGTYRLETALDKQCKVCIMCSELKPHECHRSKLIGKALDKKKIEMLHIDETGTVRSQQYVINQITKGTLNIFGDTDVTNFSRKKYNKQAQETEQDYDY